MKDFGTNDIGEDGQSGKNILLFNQIGKVYLKLGFSAFWESFNTFGKFFSQGKTINQTQLYIEKKLCIVGTSG